MSVRLWKVFLFLDRLFCKSHIVTDITDSMLLSFIILGQNRTQCLPSYSNVVEPVKHRTVPFEDTAMSLDRSESDHELGLCRSNRLSTCAQFFIEKLMAAYCGYVSDRYIGQLQNVFYATYMVLGIWISFFVNCHLLRSILFLMRLPV